MNNGPGSVQIVDRLSAVEAIKRLNEEDLLFLNRLIIERFNLFRQARSAAQMTRFTVEDEAGFTSSGVGVILHRNGLQPRQS